MDTSSALQLKQQTFSEYENRCKLKETFFVFVQNMFSKILPFKCNAIEMSVTTVNLRNELNFWNVHGIMNTSGLLQSNLKPEYFWPLTK